MAVSARGTRARVSGGVACLALLGLAAGALGAGASAASLPPSVARSVAALDGHRAVPAPGDSSSLDAVSCTAPASCWAVGGYTRGPTDFNQVQRWNGRRWTLVPAPGRGNNEGNAGTALNDVTCVTPASCWAVGELGRRDGSEHNQALHWNGRSWSPVSVPDPSAGGTDSYAFSYLSAVSCAAPDDCWAVGSSERGDSAPQLNQVLHWNGRKWSLVSVPQPGGTNAQSLSELFGVSCATAASCWAVGSSMGAADTRPQRNQVLHWNGRKWSRVSVPSPNGFGELFGLSCTAPGSCWAVGAHVIVFGANEITALNQALHWDGRRWSLVAVPDQDGTSEGAGNELIDVGCTSPADCWAVGSSGNVFGRVAGIELNQALHWNGRKWSLVATPDPDTGRGEFVAANVLIGVGCASAASCWAVGDLGPNGPNEALHWNGRRWSIR